MHDDIRTSICLGLEQYHRYDASKIQINTYNMTLAKPVNPVNKYIS